MKTTLLVTTALTFGAAALVAPFEAARADATPDCNENPTGGTVSLECGRNATASGTGGATAVGANSDATGDESTAVGEASESSGFQSTAVGEQTTASDTDSTALGNSADATGFDATALGADSDASGSSSLAVGADSTASGSLASAVGDSSGATGDSATALGNSALATADSATALGFSADATSLGIIYLRKQSRCLIWITQGLMRTVRIFISTKMRSMSLATSRRNWTALLTDTFSWWRARPGSTSSVMPGDVPRVL